MNSMNENNNDNTILIGESNGTKDEKRERYLDIRNKEIELTFRENEPPVNIETSKTAMGHLIRRSTALAYKTKELEKQSNTDKLTGLGNKRLFDYVLDLEMHRVERYKNQGIGLITGDVQNFKRVNDNYGHPFGDTVLISIGEKIKASIRKGDVPCRIGGDEFAIVIPETNQPEGVGISQKDALAHAAIRLNEAIHAISIQKPNQGNYMPKLDFGVTCSDAKDDPSKVRQRSDNACYLTKILNKSPENENKIVIASFSENRKVIYEQAWFSPENTLNYQPIHNAVEILNNRPKM
jgi:diguanylate cyclase (GGDEF)-like protein